MLFAQALWDHQLGDGPAVRLRTAATQQLFRGGVEVNDPAVLIHCDDRIECRLENGGFPRFAFAQGAFGVDSFDAEAKLTGNRDCEIDLGARERMGAVIIGHELAEQPLLGNQRNKRQRANSLRPHHLLQLIGDFGHLDIQVTFDDAKAYTKPWTVTLPFDLYADMELIESICENEKDRGHMVGK